MRAKEALVRKSAFPKTPQNLGEKTMVFSGIAHMEVTQSAIACALMSQSASKAPGPDRINFRILRMIWSWNKTRITTMVQQAIRLGHHPRQWKKARGILLEKG